MTSVREELESAWNPNNMVLAVLPDSSTATAACQALRDAGFPPQDIAIFRGEEAAEHLDIEGESLNPFLKPLRMLWAYFSVEGPELRVYQEASEAGRDLMAIRAETDEQVAKIHDVLLGLGAEEIRYFTQWNISDLSERRRKSA